MAGAGGRWGRLINLPGSREWIARARLTSGVVLFAFVSSHLLNHALGIVSLDAMETGRLVFLAVWRSKLGGAVLYLGLTVHLALVFYALYRRRTLRMPAWEATQIVLGLCIPFLLALHFPATQGLNRFFGVNDLYAYVLAAIYVFDPLEGLKQAVALLAAWGHGAVGMHYWLRLKPWYAGLKPYLLGAAVLVPAWALAGFLSAGREVELLLADPAWEAAFRARVNMPGEEAVACYRACLERHPDDSISQVGLASLGELPAPPRLPDEIVLHVFDTNASGYEENMRSLGYSIPALLFESFEANFPGSQQGLQILDLGCGTGWCGELFANVASRIVGVDLSPRMLAIAGSKGVYDQLVEAELGTWLAEATDEFDLVIAANTLIYFGDLLGIVTAAARTLRPGGALLFDVERALDSPHLFHPGGRYAHSRGHVLESLEAAGLDVLALEEVVMRTQGEEEVDALLCAAVRPPR